MPTSTAVFGAGPPEGAEVTHCPGVLHIAPSPPDDILFTVSLPNGKYAQLAVDAHELETVLDTVHEKLVEAMADEHEPPAEPEPAAPIEEVPTNTEPEEEQPSE